MIRCMYGMRVFFFFFRAIYSCANAVTIVHMWYTFCAVKVITCPTTKNKKSNLAYIL